MNIAVIGGSNCSKSIYRLAESVGKLIAKEGWVLVCGGGSGVMEAACLGAQKQGGLTVGILPSYDNRQANNYLSVKIPTGLGFARNTLVVRAADFLIALSGEYGTLSELSFALAEEKKVIGIGTWDIRGVIKAKTPEQAITRIKRLLKKS